MKTVRISVAALALAMALSGGACAAEQTTPSGTDGEPTADEQQESNEFVSTALVIGVSDEQVLFVDQDTEAVYYPTLPEGTPELAVGNVVRVTGNGIMLESYPGQYPGITLIEVIDEGSPEDAEKYAEILDQVWAPRDPAQPPTASLEYATDQAIVTLAPYSCGYTWSYGASGTEKTISVDAPSPNQIDLADLTDAQASGTTEVTVSFDVTPTAVEVLSWSESDLSGDGQSVEVALTGDSVTFAVESGNRYAVQAYFDAGDVTFVFTVA